MTFAADRQVLLVLVITAEFLCVCFFFLAKRLFLLRELNHMEDVEFPFLAVGIHYFCFYLSVNELISID